MQIEFRDVASLVPYLRNARMHDDAQVDQIAASLCEFGWTNPVLIDAEGMIIAGHGRLMAARQLWQAGERIPNVEKGQVPCIVLGHLTETQRRAYVLADNKIALNSGWDEGMLVEELQALSSDDLELAGFSEADLSALTDASKVGFGNAPETVEDNAAKLAEIHAQRKKGNEATAEKNDTEKYLVIVYSTREARERALALLGLPTDERYLDASSVDLRLRFSAGSAAVDSQRKAKAASRKKAGAGG